jgi:hypothetical protein
MFLDLTAGLKLQALSSNWGERRGSEGWLRLGRGRERLGNGLPLTRTLSLKGRGNCRARRDLGCLLSEPR